MYQNIAQRIFNKLGIVVKPRLIVKLPEDDSSYTDKHVDAYAVRSCSKTIIVHQYYDGNIDIDVIEL